MNQKGNEIKDVKSKEQGQYKASGSCKHQRENDNLKQNNKQLCPSNESAK